MLFRSSTQARVEWQPSLREDVLVEFFLIFDVLCSSVVVSTKPSNTFHITDTYDQIIRVSYVVSEVYYRIPNKFEYNFTIL